MSNKDRIDLTAADFRHAMEDLGSFIDVTVDDLMQINQLANKHAERRLAEQTLVRDIMSRDVTCVSANTSLREAAKMLLELRISGLPVVDDRQRLIGVVTEADFLSAMGIPCHHPAHSLWQTLESLFRHSPDTSALPDTVSGIMQTEVITIGEEETLHQAIDEMKKYHIKRLIVADANRKVVGILTRSNLIQVLLKNIF